MDNNILSLVSELEAIECHMQDTECLQRYGMLEQSEAFQAC